MTTGSPASEIQIAVLRLGDDGKASTVSSISTLRAAATSTCAIRGLRPMISDTTVSPDTRGKVHSNDEPPTGTTNSFQGILGGPPATVFHTDEAGALSVYEWQCLYLRKDAKPIER